MLSFSSVVLQVRCHIDCFRSLVFEISIYRSILHSFNAVTVKGMLVEQFQCEKWTHEWQGHEIKTNMVCVIYPLIRFFNDHFSDAYVLISTITCKYQRSEPQSDFTDMKRISFCIYLMPRLKYLLSRSKHLLQPNTREIYETSYMIGFNRQAKAS